MKLLSIFTFLILLTNASAQREIILAPDAAGWAFTRTLDDNNFQFRPKNADPDFWETWSDQSFGAYTSPLVYDGPSFITNQQAPFSAGNVPGIQGGTSFDLPVDAIWNYGYFLKVIDGGTFGYQNLNLKILAKDGASVFLNGKHLGSTPGTFGLGSSNPTFNSLGDGLTFTEIDLTGYPSYWHVLRPGPNLVAVVAGRKFGQTEDFGVKVELSGEPGIPPITPYTINTEGNRIHLRWSTAVPQKTIVRISSSTFGEEPEIYQSATATRNHYFTHEAPYTNSTHGSNRSYLLLKPDLQPWEQDFVNGLRNSAYLSAPGYEAKIIFTHEDANWRYLQVRAPNGNDIDPALADPDFHKSWFRQIPLILAPLPTSPSHTTAQPSPKPPLQFTTALHKISRTPELRLRHQLVAMAILSGCIAPSMVGRPDTTKPTLIFGYAEMRLFT